VTTGGNRVTSCGNGVPGWVGITQDEASTVAVTPGVSCGVTVTLLAAAGTATPRSVALVKLAVNKRGPASRATWPNLYSPLQVTDCVGIITGITVALP
jgi:hypothetical protein